MNAVCLWLIHDEFNWWLKTGWLGKETWMNSLKTMYFFEYHEKETYECVSASTTIYLGLFYIFKTNENQIYTSYKQNENIFGSIQSNFNSWKIKKWKRVKESEIQKSNTRNSVQVQRAHPPGLTSSLKTNKKTTAR